MHELITETGQGRLTEVAVWPDRSPLDVAGLPSIVGSVYADADMLAIRLDSVRCLVRTASASEPEGIDVTDAWTRLVVPARVADDAWSSACTLDRYSVERDRRAVFTRFARVRALVLPASVLRSAGEAGTGFQVWLPASYGAHVNRWLEEDLGELGAPSTSH